MALLELIGLGHARLGPLELSVAAGECVGLFGDSGAGKSQLLRAIADLDPNSGEVLLDGVERSSHTGHAWRRRVGYLAAESHWWFDTVGEHFSTPPAPEQLKTVGFDAEVMNWSLARCSTGEKQRLALLRLLANQPRVLLLDEPTAALDPDATQRVEALIEHYRSEQQAALLWVSHDPAQLLRVATRRYRISDGELQPQGLVA